jgi:hypothetical protein
MLPFALYLFVLISAIFFSSPSDRKYGDLEVFLFGLDLGNLREVFQSHQVDFPLLLTMNEEDLANVGCFFFCH